MKNTHRGRCFGIPASCQSSNVRQGTATGRLAAKRNNGAALLRNLRASMRTALSVSRVMWMHPGVPQGMCERQGGILLRWDDLQRLGGGKV